MSQRLIGKSMQVAEGYEKVTGIATYTADVKLPGMLHAKILGSPHSHAMVKNIDVSDALKIRGVKAIITYKDIAQIEFLPHESRPLLALTDHARCLGDEIAAVAAETEEAAGKALEAIKVDYDVLPAVFDPVEAMKPDAPKLYPQGNLDAPDRKPYEVSWGDVESEFSKAHAVAEREFKTQIHVTSPIEPRACVAVLDRTTGELTAWVSTQFPHRVREDIARVCQLPVSKVRVISNFIGGAFGGKKQERYPVIAALLALKVKDPVKLTYTRMQEFMLGRRRGAPVMHAKLAADASGNFTAFKFEATYDVGAYGNFVGGSLHFLLSELYAYKFKTAQYRAWDVCTNTIPAQPFRGVQMPAFHFAIEQLIDEIGEKLGIDPIEIRLKNTYREGAVMPPFGTKLSSFGIEECAREVKEAVNWSELWKGYGKPISQNGSKKVGVGIAFSLGWCDWFREATSAIVKIETDGTAVLLTGTQDIGTSNKFSIMQMVGESLGLDFSDVNIVSSDTKATPTDFGCCASRTTFVGGMAATRAAEDAKRKLLDLAAAKLEISPRDLVLENKIVMPKGTPSKGIPVNQIINGSVIGEVLLEPSPKIEGFREQVYIGGAVVHLAVVEVDEATGQTKILKYVAAHDVGRAINPAAIKDQIIGATIQAIGYGLSEELVVDSFSGSYQNPTYSEYKIPSLSDIGEIKPIIVETNEPFGPFGAKGVGEHAISPGAAAIVNAIYNAVGARVTQLPATSHRVWKALKSN
jgi:xanthine dehydrogenase molybdenum-binding subunit